MFLDNKYTQIYYRIIELARSRPKPDCYTEKHHVIPKSLGGKDDLENIVVLTAREHFVCHRLLTKMVTGRAKYQMDHAVFFMVKNTTRNGLRCNSRLFEQLKLLANEAISNLLTGIKRSPETRERVRQAALRRPKESYRKPKSAEHRRRLSEVNRGKEIPQETRRKISEANTGQKRTDLTKQRISAALKGRPVVHTDETRAAISAALKGRPSPMRGKTPWNKGGSHSEESKAQMRLKHQDRPMITCQHCGKTVPKPNYARWHGLRCQKVQLKD